MWIKFSVMCVWKVLFFVVCLMKSHCVQHHPTVCSLKQKTLTPPLRPDLTRSEEHPDAPVVDLLLIWLGTHPTVWTLTPGQRGPHHTPLFPPASGSWHHMAHSHIYYSSPSLPTTAVYLHSPDAVTLGWALCCSSFRKKGKKDEEGEATPRCHSIHLLSQRTKANRSRGLKSTTAEKWICAEIAERTLASSILGQHAKRLEKLGRS